MRAHFSLSVSLLVLATLLPALARQIIIVPKRATGDIQINGKPDKLLIEVNQDGTVPEDSKELHVTWKTATINSEAVDPYAASALIWGEAEPICSVGGKLVGDEDITFTFETGANFLHPCGVVRGVYVVCKLDGKDALCL